MSKLSKIAMVSLLGALVAMPTKHADAMPLPSPVEGVFDIVLDVQQILNSAMSLEETLAAEMATFDYAAGLPGSFNIKGMWGSFDPNQLISSSAISLDIQGGGVSVSTEAYSSALGASDWKVESVATAVNDNYRYPAEPTDEDAARIDSNLRDGFVTAITTSFGLSVSLIVKYKYNMEDFLAFDDSLLTSDDTSTSKYYMVLAKMNGIAALSVLEDVQMIAKETEVLSMGRLYNNNE